MFCNHPHICQFFLVLALLTFPATSQAFEASIDAPFLRNRDFFGSKGCDHLLAFASNHAYTQPMMNAGFKFAGDYVWANNAEHMPQFRRGYPKYLVTTSEDIAKGTHVMSVLEVNGDKLTVVSGNADGGPVNGAGTAHVEKISYSTIEVAKKFGDFTLKSKVSHANHAACLKMDEKSSASTQRGIS